MTEITETLPISHEETSTRAYVVLVIGILAVALAAILIRLAQAEAMHSLLIAAGRLILAALILTPATLRNPMFMKQIKALTRFEAGLVGISGLFLAMHFASWVTSLEYTTVLISVVLVTTSSIWVALMEVFLLRGRLPNSVIAGLGIVLVGSVVIGSGSGLANGSSGDQIYGGLLAAFGALTVAVYMIIGKRLRPKLSLIPYIWMVYGIAAIILSVALIVTATPITGFSAEGYLWVIALALVPQLIGHSSLNYALAYLPATFVSIATQAEPIGSAIIAYFVFTEIPDIWQVLGSVVILGGVIFASVGQNRANNRSK